jgi:hypothetical protein
MAQCNHGQKTDRIKIRELDARYQEPKRDLDNLENAWSAPVLGQRLFSISCSFSPSPRDKYE